MPVPAPVPVPATAPQRTVAGPPTDSERAWMASLLAGLKEAGIGGDAARLSVHLEQQLKSWMQLAPAQRPDPQLMISAFGLAWGEALAAQQQLEWAVVRTGSHADFVLVDATGAIRELPLRLVSERWQGSSAKPL